MDDSTCDIFGHGWYRSIIPSPPGVLVNWLFSLHVDRVLLIRILPSLSLGLCRSSEKPIHSPIFLQSPQVLQQISTFAERLAEDLHELHRDGILKRFKISWSCVMSARLLSIFLVRLRVIVRFRQP